MEITVDAKLMFSVFSVLVLGPICWILRNAISDLKELQKEFADYRLEVSENYLPKQDYHRDLAEIKDLLDRIFNKLDGKADK